MRLAWAVAAGLLTSAAFGQGVVVHPSGRTLPVNTLRLSVTFDERPAGDPTLALTGVNVPPGASAFVRPYLWTADGRTVTVLFDPARLKTGVGANEALGRVLRPGGEVALTVDGRPIKWWRVTAAVTRPPEPSRWTVEAAAAGTLRPIRITFDQPIDALSRDLIAIAAAAVPGTAVLEPGELVWRFIPEVAWTPGRYRIAISPALEDASGNAIAGCVRDAVRRRVGGRAAASQIRYRLGATGRTPWACWSTGNGGRWTAPPKTVASSGGTARSAAASATRRFRPNAAATISTSRSHARGQAGP